MRRAFRPVFMGMTGGIGSDEAVIPILRRPLVVVARERRPIVRGLVAEHGTELLMEHGTLP